MRLYRLSVTITATGHRDGLIAADAAAAVTVRHRA